MNNTDNKPARKQAIVLNHKRATRGCLSRAVEYGRLTVGQLKAALETVDPSLVVCLCDGPIGAANPLESASVVTLRENWFDPDVYTPILTSPEIRELRKKIHDEACNSAAKLSNPKKRR